MLVTQTQSYLTATSDPSSTPHQREGFTAEAVAQILATPVHESGPSIFATPTHENQGSILSTPLPETGLVVPQLESFLDQSLTTLIDPLPGFDIATPSDTLPNVLERKGLPKEEHGYCEAPATLPAFPKAVEVEAKTRNHAGKLRSRWEDKRRIYEWDFQHGTVEMYSSKTGKHMGEYNPDTGEMTKGPNKQRKIET